MPQTVTVQDPRRVVNVVMHPLAARELEVHRVEVIGPAMIRVVLAGSDAGTVPFLPWTSDDHVKLLFPEPGQPPVLPGIVDGRPRWGEARGELRDYTVRAVDAVAGTLTIDGVVHLHGPAGRWFARAAVGDRLGVLGPRGSHVYPPGYGHYVLLGDETALPALGRWLDEPGLRARITLVTAAEEPDAYPLPEPAAPIEPHHLVLPSGTERGAALAEHLRVALAAVDDPDDVFVWAAGEATALRAVRSVLRESAVPRHAWAVDGYWRLGVAGLDHHAKDDDEG